MTDRPILLVEDNDDDVALTLRAFRVNAIPNAIHVARTGPEAIDRLIGDDVTGPSGPLPAVVLLDLNLPLVDGLEVLRRIRAHPRTRLVPVVILSSSDERADLESGYRLGANSFVRKPVAFGDLRDSARLIGLYWLGLNMAVPGPHAGSTGAIAGGSGD